MLLPHEREELENSRSLAAATRASTIIGGCFAGMTTFSCLTANNIELVIILGFILFIANFFFFYHGWMFVTSHLTVMKLEYRSKINARNFFQDLAAYREEFIQQKIASPLESDA